MAVVQAVTLVLGVISLAGAAASHARSGSWFMVEAPGVAMVLTALVFTGAVLGSRELRSLAPRCADVGDDGEDFEQDPALGEHD